VADVRAPFNNNFLSRDFKQKEIEDDQVQLLYSVLNKKLNKNYKNNLFKLTL